MYVQFLSNSFIHILFAYFANAQIDFWFNNISAAPYVQTLTLSMGSVIRYSNKQTLTEANVVHSYSMVR